MADEKKIKEPQNWNWFQARLRTKLWTACLCLMLLYCGFFAYAYYVQGLNLLNLGQLGLNKYNKNPAEVLRNITWSYGLLIGGVFAVLGFVNAIHRTQQKDRELDAAEARLQIEQSSERRKTDAEIFAKSVEQLGNEQMAIRLGGLYSLENLARSAQALPLDTDYKAYLNSLLETLAAFVRMRAPTPPKEKQNKDNKVAKEEQNKDSKVATDVEAAIRIISRNFPYETRKLFDAPIVDLRNCYLPKLEMPAGADMRAIDLSHSHLNNASLYNVNLDGARLEETNMRFVGLHGSSLKNSLMMRADFFGALLVNVDFHNANLDSAILLRNIMNGSDFTNATLDRAILREANLVGIKIENTSTNDTNLSSAELLCNYFSEKQINEAIWNPETPPFFPGIPNACEQRSIIDARTKEIRDDGLWEKYLERQKMEKKIKNLSSRA